MTGSKSKIILAGKTVWAKAGSGSTVRTTYQIAAPGLYTLPDRSTQYNDLMNDLDEVERSVENIEEALYFINVEPNGTLKFNALTR